MPSLRTPDGTQLYYRDWGAGRPVVFVHSLLMNGDMWQYPMYHLAEHGYRAIAYDRRGHGRSDDPGTGYDFDTLADDLAAVLDTLGLSEVALVGHSMGGGEVVRFLSRHGDELISRVALVGSTVPYLGLEPAEAAAHVDRLRTGYGQWVEENAAFSFGSASIPQVEKDRTIRDWMAVSLKAAVDCTAANLAADFRAEAAAIRVPSLVVHGDSDVFAPLEICGQRTAELIPDSKLVIYRNGSHMLHLSHRRQLDADLLDFVSG